MKSKWNQSSFALVFCLAFASSALAWSSPPETRKEGNHSVLVHDLRATRKGDKITLTWSQPSDALHSGATRICRSTAATASSVAAGCAKPVGEVKPSKVAAVAGKTALRFT